MAGTGVTCLHMYRDSIRSRLHGVVEVLPVRPDEIVTQTAQIHTLDLTAMGPEDAYCRAAFTLAAKAEVLPSGVQWGV